MWNNCSKTEAETRTRNSFPHSYVRHTKKIFYPIHSVLIDNYILLLLFFFPIYTTNPSVCVMMLWISEQKKEEGKGKKYGNTGFCVFFYFIGWDRHWHMEGIQRKFYDGQCIGMQMLSSSLWNISHQIMFLIIKKLLLRQIWIGKSLHLFFSGKIISHGH